MTDEPILTSRQKSRLDQAENEIREILFALEEQVGLSIEHVEVDTRNFGQLKTEITLTEETRH